MREVFLPLARHRHVVPGEAVDALEEYAWWLRDSARPLAMAGAPSLAEPAPPAAAVRLAGDRIDLRVPAARPASDGLAAAPAASRPAPDLAVLLHEREPVQPGRLTLWWRRARGELGADLAMHGLAYLGVLLLFVGVFGLVAFSFGDVAEGLRPVAEIGIAAAPFLAAWMLLRRGAEVAGRSLEVAGGLLLPIMLITSLLDGVPVPPDLLGVTLVVATTSIAVVLAALYALWTRRHPASSLRYLVAPLVWLAAGLAVMGVGRDIPSGSGVASVTAAQSAAMAAAMAVTLALARLRPDAVLSEATRVSARAGAVVVGLLAVLSWAAGGWPVVPVLVSGIAGLAVLELLGVGGTRLAAVLWWAVTCLALAAGAGSQTALGAVAATGAVGFVVLVELAGRERRGLPAALAAGGAVVGTALSLAAPWIGAGAAAAVSVWAGIRRLRPFDVRGSRVLLDIAAGTAPVLAVVAVGAATRSGPVAVLAAAGLVALSLVALAVPAVRWVVRRDESDHFWQLWWDVGMAGTFLAAVVLWSPEPSSTAPWLLVAAVAVLAASAALGPIPRSWRCWPALALGLLAWVMAGALADWAPPVRALPVALVGVAAVVLVHVVGRRLAPWSSPGSLGLAGIALAAVAVAGGAALAGSPTGWLVVALLACLAAVLVLTTAFDEIRWSPVVDSLRSVLPGAGRPDVHVAAVAATTAVAVLAVDALGWVAVSTAWTGTTISAVALLCALLTPLPLSVELRRSLVWCSVALAIVGLGTVAVLPATLVGLIVIAALPVAMPSPARPRAAVWLAWSSAAPIVGASVALAQPWFAALLDRTAFALAMAGTGGVMLVGAAALDLPGRGWTAQPLPRRAVLRIPALVGAADVVVALLVAVVVGLPAPYAGWLVVGVALVAAAEAMLSRTWSMLALAAALGWLGAWTLASSAIESRPWVSLMATVLLLAAAEAASLLGRDTRPWVRADLPLLGVAHITALTALLTAGVGGAGGLVLASLGALAAAVAWRLRTIAAASWIYALASAGLVVAGGWLAGPGWLALALLAVAAVGIAAAQLLPEVVRPLPALAGASCLVASAVSASAWLALPAELGAGLIVVGAGAALVGLALLQIRLPALRNVWISYASVALIVVTGAPLVSAAVAGGPVLAALTWWTVAGLGLAAAACAIAAASLSGALRYAAVLYGLGAVVEGFAVVGASSGWQFAVLVGIALAASAAILLPLRETFGAWRLPVAVSGGAAVVASIAVAVVDLPDPWLLPGALLVAGGYAAACGAAFSLFALVALAPVLVCAAWIAWVADTALSGPQWYTVPVGLTLLVLVGLIRGRAARQGGQPDAVGIRVLELVGVLVLVGSSFVQAFTDSLGYALVAAGLSAGVAVWGVLTRVRRRLVLGSALVLAAVAVVVLVPLAQLIPGWSSAVLWIVVACVGLVSLALATLLEQGRALVRKGSADFHRLTETWE